MELRFLGQSSFRMRFKNGMVLVTDPFEKEKCDVMTLSDGGTGTGLVAGAVKREETFVINEEGEYEVGGVEVVAVKNEKENLIMVVRQNGINVCHLGDLKKSLTEKQIEAVGPIDVLLVPVGGEGGVDDKEVGELISNMSPSVVVPMRYTKNELSEFLDKSSLEVMLEGVDKVKIDVNTLPENTKCLVLKSPLIQ